MTVVIVGASVAGVACAKALRAEGYDGTVTLIGDERRWPYDKPPLSKSVLTGDAAGSSPLLAESDLRALEINMLMGMAATGLDSSRRILHLGKDQLRFDELVVATGARALQVPPWSAAPVLRTLDDALKLRRALTSGQRLVIVGAGVLGLEVASSACQRGLDVTVLDIAPRVMMRAFGGDVSGWAERLFERSGVRIRLGISLAGVHETSDGWSLQLANGDCLESEHLLACVGTTPNLEWCSDSGLVLDRGVVCDGQGRAAPSIYAIGDVSRWCAPDGSLAARGEHWSQAGDQARIVAAQLTRPHAEFAGLPVSYVWSDLLGNRVQGLGNVSDGSCRNTVVASEASDAAGESRDKRVILHADSSGLLGGATVVNWPRATIELRRALGERRTAAEVTSVLRTLG